MQLIDEKTKIADLDDRVHIYDLNPKSLTLQNHTINPQLNKSGGAFWHKEGVDAGTCTDFSRKLLAPKDWYFSALNRKMVRQWFLRNRMAMDSEISGEFVNHDCENFYRDIDEPNPNHKKYKHKVKEATSKLFSETSSLSSLGELGDVRGHSDKHDKHQLTEAEITYLIGIYKKKNQKWCERSVLKEVRTEAMYTAKMICKDTVEG